MTVDVFASKSGYQSTDSTQSLLGCNVCVPQTSVLPSTNQSGQQQNQTTNVTPSRNETVQSPTTNQSGNQTTPQFSLIAPPTANTGENITISTDCPTCTLQVKGPDGKVKTFTPDSTGKVTLPVGLSGSYQISLLGPDGATLKTLNVNASGGMPTKTTGSESTPTESPRLSGGILVLVLGFIVVALILLGGLYWFVIRNKSKKKK